jgi:serine/threonine protein kinase
MSLITLTLEKTYELTSTSAKCSFKVLELLPSESTRSLSYKGIWTSGERSEDAVAKIPRLLQHLSDKSLAIRSARIQYMQQVEIASVEKLNSLGSVDTFATVLSSGTIDVNINRNGQVGQEDQRVSIALPVIIQKYIEGEPLRLYFDRRSKAREGKPFAGISDSADYSILARAIVDLLSDLHRYQVIHGDISPDNLMVRVKNEEADQTYDSIPGLKDRLALIDFGESVFRNEVQTEDLAAVGALYDKPEPTSEMWDIRQTGLLLAYLAGADTATLDREMRANRDAINRKESVRRSISSRNTTLLSASPGVVDVLSKCLCSSTIDRVQSFDELKFLLDTLLPPNSVFLKPAPPDHQGEGNNSLFPVKSDEFGRLFREAETYADSHTKRVLSGLLIPAITNFVAQAQDLKQGIQLINGSMREIEACLASIFARVRDGDEYLTLSSVDLGRGQSWR